MLPDESEMLERFLGLIERQSTEKCPVAFHRLNILKACVAAETGKTPLDVLCRCLKPIKQLDQSEGEAHQAILRFPPIGDVELSSRS